MLLKITEKIIRRNVFEERKSTGKHLTPKHTISFENVLIMIHSLYTEVSLYATLTFKIMP